MTAPTQANATPKAPTIVGDRAAKPTGAFGTPTPPDHRTTALQSAVAVMRGNKPIPETSDVLNMAEAFYQFLKAGD